MGAGWDRWVHNEGGRPDGTLCTIAAATVRVVVDASAQATPMSVRDASLAAAADVEQAAAVEGYLAGRLASPLAAVLVDAAQLCDMTPPLESDSMTS